MILVGFDVRDAEDEYRPYALRVVAGRGDGIPSSWALRDDELSMPGWAARATGDGSP
ncbi:MAG: hypothetical protein M3Y33_07570 [Actinomycetota bacterium]|nr:hypothetical protein [Actinomycetota bacterium]